jgi:CheY-like chemotaxis protein
MEALGTLAGGVAHEFNNLMGGIIGYCDMALKSEGEDLPERALRISLKAANRASVIARNLLRFASRAEHRREPADLNTAVRDTVCLLQSDLESERIALQTDLQTLPAIRLDLAQMQQVFLNLVINARQALQDQRQGRRRIEIRTWCEGDRVCASVRDNGPGIPAEHLGRVTEPFFTTRGLLSGGEGGATGLGLSVVDGIVRGHGGELSVTSDPGEGTCFTLRLPHIEETTATETPRVLLIDDDPAILRLLGAILEHHDCRVVGAGGGPEALERIRDESFSVAVLDYSMPGMDGVEVLRELQLLAPDLPVIMLTALHTPELAREAVLAGARECLAKPINNEKLLFLIRKYGAGDDTYEPKTAEPVATRQKHILVVDDDDTIRDVYGLVLARAGFRTTTVADQQEAVAHTEASYFDLIILDLLLPGADGQLLVRTLRANNPYTPIIISTSEASDHVLREGLNAGASRVLLKPVNPEGLVQEVTHLMAIYQQQMPGV